MRRSKRSSTDGAVFTEEIVSEKPEPPVNYNAIYNNKRRYDLESKYRIGPIAIDQERLEKTGRSKPGKLKVPFGYENSTSVGLLTYFWAFTNSLDKKDIDLNLIKKTLDHGTDINTRDDLGQTILFAIVRDWHVDVTLFAIRYGADVNAQDDYGRSPLHLASALNYLNVAEVLLQHGADPNLETFKEKQTPVHYAAKHNSLEVLKHLIRNDGSFLHRDHKNRTPFFIASEKGCDKTANFLIEIGVPVAVFDIHGNSALAYLVENIPSVAFQALGQYIERTKKTKQCRVYIGSLEGIENGISCNYNTLAKSTLDVIAMYSDFNLVMHPVVQTSIDVKWKAFGRKDTIRKLIISILYCVCWVAAQFILHDTNERHSDWSEYGWGLFVEIPIVLFAIYFLVKDITHMLQTVRRHDHWMEWKLNQTIAQYVYCHPGWPSERQAVRNEENMIKTLKSFASRNVFWFAYECLNMVILSSVIIIRVLHLVYIEVQIIATVHHLLFSINMACAFIRIIKIGLRFRYFAIFLKVASLASTSFFQIVFLYIQFYIPFVAVFWLWFGKPDSVNTNHLQPNSTDNITLGKRDDQTSPFLLEINHLASFFYHVYTSSMEQEELRTLEAIDMLATDIFLILFHVFTTYLALSIIIAFITAKFSTNVKRCIAEASLLQSTVVLQLERKLSRKDQAKLTQYYVNHCSPLLVNNLDLPEEVHGRNAEWKLDLLLVQLTGISRLIREFENRFKNETQSKSQSLLRDNYKSAVSTARITNRSMERYHTSITSEIKPFIDRQQFFTYVIPGMMSKSLNNTSQCPKVRSKNV